MKRIAVIGGGYAGTAFAIHVTRAARSPLEVIVVEPRAEVGGGLAHSDADPDHRLNASDVIHPLFPDDDLHFRGWLESTGRLAADPYARYADERQYPRRGDFGAYLTAQFALHARSNRSGSTLTQRCGTAVSIERRGDGFHFELAAGDPFEAERCVIAIGQEPVVSSARASAAERWGCGGGVPARAMWFSGNTVPLTLPNRASCCSA